MKTFLKVIFTDASNQDFDFAKVMGGLALCAFIGISIHAYGVKNVLFDPLNWATGISIIIGAASGVSKHADKSGAKPD
jgi:high-affinity Fe2+/Pb2+ permease